MLPKKTNKDDADNRSVSVKVVSDEQIEELDNFSELFGGGDDNITVKLFRIEPKFHEGISCGGFVGDLSPGDTLSTIKNQYGGGYYKLQKFKNGRFSGSNTVRIVGFPKLESPSSLEALPVIPVAGQPSVTGLEVNGVPIDGSNQDFLDRLERVAIIKGMFPESNKVDINETLLTLAVQKGGTTVDSIGDFAKMIEAAKALIPGAGSGSGGSTVIDVLKEGIGAFSKYLEAASSQAQRPVSMAVKPTVGDPENLRKPLVAVPSDEPLRVENTAKEEPSMQQIALSACQFIVGGFISSPRQTAEQTANVINLGVPPIPALFKGQVVKQRQALKDMAVNMLGQSVDPTTEESSEFLLFFDEVFNIFFDVSNEQ